MRLSDYTDYSLRVLMYCTAHPGRLVTIAELAAQHGVSKNHLMKVVNDLARQGLLETTRGRGGGVRLLRQPADIRVGEVVRRSETDFRLVECFDLARNACVLTPVCRLKSVFGAALAAYFEVLDGATLADISGPVVPADQPAVAFAGRVAAGPRPVSAPVSRRRAAIKPAA